MSRSLVIAPATPLLRHALALHTTTSELGLALTPLSNSSELEQTKAQVWDLGHSLSTQLHVKLQAFIQPLDWADIALIAVACGPGGFTGTRIGVVAARTLAQQLRVPLFAISSLAAVAWKAALERHQDDNTAIAVEMPARRGQVFVAIYDVECGADGQPAQFTAKLPDTVMDQADWEEVRQRWAVPFQQVSAAGGLGETVGSVLAIALQDWHRGDRPHWSAALPFYGQSPV
ncbi:MAG: tRNA (adenosine(37)-N6)-threonylcarbamoyltransferase complex dimerization subunit type 1 TsaB [Elainellaceae cyanobacterium]